VLQRLDGGGPQDVEVALDELARIEHILDRLLLLANAKQPDFVVFSQIDVEPFLEDVFMRWSEVVPRGWTLGPLAPGTLRADHDALRSALDALLENAVKYTEQADAITLSARSSSGALVIEVADEGCGLPSDALERIFERFARSDSARSRSQGGAGLGLAIVDAIVKAHGGSCTAANTTAGAVFSVRFPGFTPARAAAPAAPLLH
jgi:signal transduction histidine kinase